jgi:uncharacterized phage protein (TIGR02218 family)
VKDFSPLSLTDFVVGFPARIGVITRVDGTVIRFTESNESIIVEGDAFSVIPGLHLSAVKETSNGEVPSCQLIALHGDGYTIDSQDLDVGLFDGATVQIYKVDLTDLSRKGLEFTGAISNTSYIPNEHQVSFDVKGASASSRIVMTQKRSPMCRTDLFSTLCQVNKASYAVSTSVATIGSAFVFTVSGSLAQADGYFNQGVAVTASGVAFEISNWVQSTQAITSYLPCDRLLSVSLGLTLYPGCDKTDTAKGCGKFTIADPNGNYINFQGENHFLGTAAAAQQV